MNKQTLHRWMDTSSLTVRAMTAAVLLSCFLPLVKLTRILAFIESRKNAQQCGEAAIAQMIRTIGRIARFRLFVVRNNCLKKSLLFYYFHLRSGVQDVCIHIGISKADDQLDGHSWLTVGGELFQETEETVSKYKIIYSSGVRQC